MIEDNNTPQNVGNENPDKFPGNEGKRPPAMKIVGYNMIILVAYTILSAVTAKGGGFILDALFIAVHVFIGIIMAIAGRSWTWLFSALLVLLIGFSTCVGIGNFSGGI